MSRMVTSVAALITVLSILAGSLVSAQDDLKPEIYLPQLRHDFGKVFERDKYEHDFVVKNRGKADLIIEKVKPG